MDDTHRDHELDALLQAADPWPASRAVDPAIADRAIAFVQKEQNMHERADRPRRRFRTRSLAAAAAAAALVVAAGVATLQLTGEDANTVTGSGRAVGDAFASCLPFTLETLGRSPVAFDGTVTDVSEGRITFDVERWYRGGEGDTVTASAPSLVGEAPQLNGGVGFVEGGRYLVSGDTITGELVPAICGYSVEYTQAMAADWERAFGG